MYTGCNFWDDRWQRNHLFRHSFPKYIMDKEESVMQYIKDYYKKAREYEKAYPDIFKMFPIDYLNTEDGVASILSFAGIKEMVVKVRIRTNTL